MDIFSDKALEQVRRELQEPINKMVEFHERLLMFVLDLKELKNSDVDKLFEKHQVEIKYEGQ